MWIYNDSFLSEIPADKYGFVYELEFKSGMKYRGKKSFFSFVTLPPLKGSRKKRKVIKESNWARYVSSCKDIPSSDKVISKKILALANSKQHLSYLEDKFLFEVDACINDLYYNKNISGRYYDNVANIVGDFLKFNI